MGLAALSQVLWHERELLEVLVFKLEEEQLVLASGKTRWLARATREVEVIVEEMRLCEVRRAIAVDEVAGLLGLPIEPTLAQLAAASPAPWDELLKDHRTAFMSLTSEIRELAEGNRTLLAAGYRSSREALVALSGRLTREESGYSRTGRKAFNDGGSQLVDQAL